MSMEPDAAGFFRRLAAIVYDSFLVVAIWMISTILVVAVLNDGQAIWRIVYRIDPDAIVIAGVFRKQSPRTPKAVIEACKHRLKRMMTSRREEQ